MPFFVMLDRVVRRGKPSAPPARQAGRRRYAHRGGRGGRLNDPRFGSRMRGEGIFAEQMEALYQTACRRQGLTTRSLDLSTAAFRRLEPPGPAQLGLFEAGM